MKGKKITALLTCAFLLATSTFSYVWAGPASGDVTGGADAGMTGGILRASWMRMLRFMSHRLICTRLYAHHILIRGMML